MHLFPEIFRFGGNSSHWPWNFCWLRIAQNFQKKLVCLTMILCFFEVSRNVALVKISEIIRVGVANPPLRVGKGGVRGGKIRMPVEKSAHYLPRGSTIPKGVCGESLYLACMPFPGMDRRKAGKATALSQYCLFFS